jgi:hypothetical protein
MSTIIEGIVSILMFGFACHESYALVNRQRKAIVGLLNANKPCIAVWLKVILMIVILMTAAGPVAYYGYKVLIALGAA